MIKAIMNGCNGKMGQVISAICKEDPQIEIVAGVDLYDGIKNDYPVFPNISVCDVKADVIIDFSNAKAVDDLLVYSVDKKIPVVLCTTGLSEEQMEQVKAASGQVAVLKSANMSLGINLLMQLLAQAATILAPAGFDMEIVEKHHNQKLDAPSSGSMRSSSRDSTRSLSSSIPHIPAASLEKGLWRRQSSSPGKRQDFMICRMRSGQRWNRQTDWTGRRIRQIESRYRWIEWEQERGNVFCSHFYTGQKTNKIWSAVRGYVTI